MLKEGKFQVSYKNTNRERPEEHRGRRSRCPANAQLLILISTPANWLGPDLLPEEFIARAAVSNLYFYFLY